MARFYHELHTDDGQPRVTVLNAAELGVPASIGATSNTETWGDKITSKPSE